MTARRDQAWRELPLGQEISAYLRAKSTRIADASVRGFEAVLSELALFYPELTLEQLEPPAGTHLIEEFLTVRWGDRNPRTFNKSLTMVSGLTKWLQARGRLLGDPTVPIERARVRQFHRSTFSEEQRLAILTANPEPRYQIALRLLLDYGLRKGGLGNVRFEHFDHARRRLVIFTKGSRVHTIPIPQDVFWDCLARIDDALPSHFLLCKQRVSTSRASTRRKVETLAVEIESAARTAGQIDGVGADLVADLLARAREMVTRPGLIGETVLRRQPDVAMGAHGIHVWWYRCLARAGVVEPGANRGARLHQARHTAGQRVLDRTGNLKAAQELLGHASIATTGNHYTDWGIDKLAETMRDVVPS